ncbi:MAG TPA: ice-binding family protein, partial [Polyangiaceae bacterium]
MQLAFTDAAGRAPNFTELGAGNIGGLTLPHGVYKWGTGLLIPTNVTLTGSATDVWIFEIAQNLNLSSATKVLLAGGAQAKNVFWQVSGGVVLGTTSHLEGIVLSQTAITLATGASVKGRLLAQTAVTLDTSTVTQP